jgi:hypothetical protein
MELLGSWFIDMESWELDEGIWEVDEGSWKGIEGRLGAGGRRTELEVDEEGASRIWSRYVARHIWTLYWDLGNLVGLGGTGERISRLFFRDLVRARNSQPTPRWWTRGFTFLDGPPDRFFTFSAGHSV